MIPFSDWFRLAVGALGLSPDAFWALTFLEWRWLAPQAEAMRQDELSRLVALYPDEPVAGSRLQAAAAPPPETCNPQPREFQ